MQCRHHVGVDLSAHQYYWLLANTIICMCLLWYYRFKWICKNWIVGLSRSRSRSSETALGLRSFDRPGSLSPRIRHVIIWGCLDSALLSHVTDPDHLVTWRILGDHGRWAHPITRLAISTSVVCVRCVNRRTVSLTTEYHWVPHACQIFEAIEVFLCFRLKFAICIIAK